MNFKIKRLMHCAFALMFGVAMLVAAGVTANAQGYSQKQENRDLKAHQRMERDYYGNNGQTRNHQRLERDRLKYEQRLERNGYPVRHDQYGNGSYNNGYYNGGYNNGGYYNGGYSNGGYNNGGYSGNNRGNYGYDPYYNSRRSNDSYYGNNGYYHRDSRNPIRRGIHHALGGH